MVELRRLILDPQIDPQLNRIGVVVNRLIDMANGSEAGRMWLLGDDGTKRATKGSQGVLPGASLSTNNYPLRVEPTSTNQVNVLHSNGSTIGLRVQNAGLTSGVPVSFTSTLTVTGATVLQSTLAVTGATTLSSTLAVTGATTLNGAVTLGDNASDVITVTGTATVAEDLTLTKGLIVDTTTLVVDETTNRVGILTASPRSALEVAGVIVSTAAGFPTTGSLIEMYLDTGVGRLDAFNYDAGVFLPLRLGGLSATLEASGTTRFKVDATGIGFFATAPVAQPAAAAAATDLATAITLVNSLRTGLRAATGVGLFS